MSTLSKYLLFQVPGWVIAGFILVVLVEWFELSPWLAGAFFVLWVAKDFMLYPFFRSAFRADAKTGSEELVGARGVALDPLDPSGYVRVRGELWRAQIEAGREPILPGTPIKVNDASGFILVVGKDQSEDGRAQDR